MTTSPFCNSLLTVGENVRFISPFGPFTCTSEPCTLTCTPFGTVTGKRPMRDTSTSCLLPQFTKDLAAHTQLSGPGTGHDTLGCRKDGNANPGQHPGNILFLCINSSSWFAYALDAGNHRTALAPFPHILNFEAQNLLNGLLAFGNIETLEKAFIFHDLGNLNFEFGARH